MNTSSSLALPLKASLQVIFPNYISHQYLALQSVSYQHQISYLIFAAWCSFWSSISISITSHFCFRCFFAFCECRPFSFLTPSICVKLKLLTNIYPHSLGFPILFNYLFLPLPWHLASIWRRRKLQYFFFCPFFQMRYFEQILLPFGLRLNIIGVSLFVIWETVMLSTSGVSILLQRKGKKFIIVFLFAGSFSTDV